MNRASRFLAPVSALVFATALSSAYPNPAYAASPAKAPEAEQKVSSNAAKQRPQDCVWKTAEDAQSHNDFLKTSLNNGYKLISSSMATAIERKEQTMQDPSSAYTHLYWFSILCR
jgi:hypothetical protein